MKKNNTTLLFSLLLMLLPAMLFAGSGKVFDNLTVKSKILDMERKFALYLPPDYDTSERSYPVLYLLHGGGDDQTGWVQFGEVLRITDQAIADGIATPMIIVMPDANTGRRGYSNDISGEWRYEDFIFEELVPYVESNWRIKGEKRYRAVAGLSMGGNGTFLYALHHTDMFSSACPLSCTSGQRTFEEFKNRRFRSRHQVEEENKYSDEELMKYYKDQSTAYMLENMPIDSLKSVRWYMAAGDDDRTSVMMSLAHEIMFDREISHEYRIWDGAHTWTFWRQALPHVLQFISDSFHQH